MQKKMLAKIIVIVIMIGVVIMYYVIPAFLWTYFRAKEYMWIVMEAILATAFVNIVMDLDDVKKQYNKYVTKFENLMNRKSDAEKEGENNGGHEGL